MTHPDQSAFFLPKRTVQINRKEGIRFKISVQCEGFVREEWGNDITIISKKSNKNHRNITFNRN